MPVGIVLAIYYIGSIILKQADVKYIMKEKASVFIRQRGVIAVSHDMRSEIVRKSIHLLIAFVPFFAAVNITVTMVMLGTGILLYTYAEFLRRNGKEFPLITKITTLAAREGDRNRFILGPVTLGIGAMAALLFYPEPAASIAIFALAFGDGFSSLAGKLIGGIRVPLTGGKTIVGSLTCFLVVFIVATRISGAASVACVIALSAMVLEILPTGDLDNIIIPAGTGFVAFKLLIV